MPPEDEVQHLRALVVELAQHVDLQELPAITIEAVALEDFPLIFDNDYKARQPRSTAVFRRSTPER